VNVTAKQLEAAAQLLARISAYDRRTTGEFDDIVWAEQMALHQITLNEAVAAVTEHYGSSSDFLMPIHVVRIVKGARRKRLTDAGDPPVPALGSDDDPRLQQQLEKAWRARWCWFISSGMTREQAADAANREMGVREPTVLSGVPADARRAIAALAAKLSVPTT